MLTRPVTSARERIALWTLAILFALVLAIHAGAETLYTLPVNPLGESLRPVVLAYTHPYFEQYWNMFAPTPIDRDVVVLARTRAKDGRPTAWVNLTAPLLDELRGHPFSRYATLKIAAMNLAVAAIDGKILGEGQSTGSRANTLVDPRTRPMAAEGLVRLALYLGAAGTTTAHSVQVAIVSHEFPRFTHRFDADDRTQHNDTLLSPWVPIMSATAMRASS